MDIINALPEIMEVWQGNMGYFISALFYFMMKRLQDDRCSKNKRSKVFQELAISVSDTLTPAVSALAAGAQKLVSWFNSLSEGQKRAVVTLAGIAAAAGPVMIGIGGMLKLCNSAVGVYAGMASKIMTSTKAMRIFSLAQTGLNSVMSKARVILTYLKAVYLADGVALTKRN